MEKKATNPHVQADIDKIKEKMKSGELLKDVKTQQQKFDPITKKMVENRIKYKNIRHKNFPQYFHVGEIVNIKLASFRVESVGDKFIMLRPLSKIEKGKSVKEILEEQRKNKDVVKKLPEQHELSYIVDMINALVEENPGKQKFEAADVQEVFKKWLDK